MAAACAAFCPPGAAAAAASWLPLLVAEAFLRVVSSVLEWVSAVFAAGSAAVEALGQELLREQLQVLQVAAALHAAQHPELMRGHWGWSLGRLGRCPCLQKVLERLPNRQS